MIESDEDEDAIELEKQVVDVTNSSVIQPISVVSETNDENDDSTTHDETKKINTTDEVVNFKKISVKVLREMVLSKGLHDDPSKLKKKELLKLLQ